MYDKIEEASKERFADDYKKAEISGEKRGRNAERIAIARNLFSTGVDISIISKSTGFTKDEVISLCK